MALKNQASTNLEWSAIPEIDQKTYPTIWGELLRVRNAVGVLQTALDSYTGALSEDPQYWNVAAPSQFVRIQNIARFYCITSEAIALAQTVHFWNNAGVITARLANATDGTRPARGYCSVVGGIGVGVYGEFILSGVNPYYAGLTPGSLYYQNTVNGQITTVAPAVVGNLVQPVGWAMDDKNLFFVPSIVPVIV